MFRIAWRKMLFISTRQLLTPPTAAISIAMGSSLLSKDSTSNISRSARSNRGRTISAAVLESPIRFSPYRQRPSFTISRWTIPIFFFGIGLSIIPRICSSCVYALMIVPLSPNKNRARTPFGFVLLLHIVTIFSGIQPTILNTLPVPDL